MKTTDKNYTPKTANAEYTGGGIYLFYGETTNNKWYSCDDDGYTTIHDADPKPYLFADEYTEEVEDWFAAHSEYLDDQESSVFIQAVLHILIEDDRKNGYNPSDWEDRLREEQDYYENAFESNVLAKVCSNDDTFTIVYDEKTERYIVFKETQGADKTMIHRCADYVSALQTITYQIDK